MTTSARARGRAAIAASIGFTALAALIGLALVAFGRRATPTPGRAGSPATTEGVETTPSVALEGTQAGGEATSDPPDGAKADAAAEATSDAPEAASAGAAIEARGEAEAFTTDEEAAPTPRGFGDEPARGAKAAASPALASRASTSKAQAPPPLTDPLRIDAGKLPGPTRKPSGAGSARAPREVPAPRSPAIALYHDADRSLVAGRGQECLSQLDRADATPGGPELREREQRAASPVVRAQCTMLLGRCDEGATRLRAAGWQDAAIDGARARFCAK